MKYKIYCEAIHVGYVLETITDMYRESGKFEFNDKLESLGQVGSYLRKWIIESSLLNESVDSIEDGDVEGEKRIDEICDRLELLPKFEEMNWTLVEENSQKTDKIRNVHFSYGYVGYYLWPDKGGMH